jgi:hypothetical protein
MGQASDQLAPLSDVREEGLRLVQAAAERGVPVRLLGGVAIWARCPSAADPPLRRDYCDVDIISLSKSSRDLTRFLESMGYQPDKLFNALHGAQRLNFTDVTRDRPLDVLLDRFAMCHALDLRGRLAVDPVTIPLADLLLTKLQVVQINDKDLLDLTALLADHPLSAHDHGSTDDSWTDDGSTGNGHGSIDLGRLTAVLGKDWGFEHTVRINLEKLRESLAGRGLAETTAAAVVERIAGIASALDQAGKSLAWQLRARVGERVRWYELPEDVRH